MTLNIRIKSANLTHDTQLLGQMVRFGQIQDVYVVVMSKDGREIKRTGIQKGKQPEWQHQLFMCSDEIGGLQFRLYDKESVKQDDFIGRAKWSFESVLKRPYEGLKVAVPLEFQGKNAGRLNLQVYYDEGRVYIGGNQPSSYFDGQARGLEKSRSTQQLGYTSYTNGSRFQPPPQQQTSPYMNQHPTPPPMAESNVSNTSSAHFSNSQYTNKNQQPTSRPPLPPRPHVPTPVNPMAQSQVLPVEHEANRALPMMNFPPPQQPNMNPAVQSQAVGPTLNQQGHVISASQATNPNIPPGLKPHPALNFLYSSVASKVSEGGRIHLEKIEHDSFNLFTILDGWSPFKSNFSLIPEKLRNN